jgi:flavin reductase (DIM6/NTAB) family NADH-FMN oxidoreductase RutF/DNA-binding GntR family transcriptional regulator
MLDAEVFREVMGRFASGVSVLTTAHEGRDWGMTASALCSVSLDPPTILICINRLAPSGQAIAEARHFAANILGAEQGWLAELFARPSEDKFAEVGFRRGGCGDPVLADCLAVLECQVVDEIVARSHRVLIADVLAAGTADVEPLTYYRGTFGRFELVQHSDAYRLLFDKMVDGSIPANEPLVADELAGRFGLPPSAVGYALIRLIGDGLVTREPQVGYRRVAFDPAHAIECYDAKRVIDLAVADLTVGKVPAAAVRRLRTLCDRANGYVTPGGIRDVASYRAATMAFQEAAVGLAGNRAFLSTVRALRIPELIAMPQEATQGRATEIASNRSRIVAGYESGDLQRTRDALNDQADLHIELSLNMIAGQGSGSPRPLTHRRQDQ